MQNEDEGIQAVRDVRKAISAEFGDDPERLVEHYIGQQELHRDRLIRPGAVREAGAADKAPPVGS